MILHCKTQCELRFSSRGSRVMLLFVRNWRPVLFFVQTPRVVLMYYVSSASFQRDFIHKGPWTQIIFVRGVDMSILISYEEKHNSKLPVFQMNIFWHFTLLWYCNLDKYYLEKCEIRFIFHKKWKFTYCSQLVVSKNW